jgi:hypothetical protein
MKPECIEVSGWQTPATAYPARRLGSAAIADFTYPPGTYENYGLRGYSSFRVTKPIRVRNLKVNRKVWMVDDPPHWWAMQEHASKYHGHVVCAGLGLGLIVHALTQNPKVTRITVVEINKDVIHLIKPLVPDCEVIHADFRDWWGMADGIFFDLFVGDGRRLFHAAVGVFVRLALDFPDTWPIRIHGFNNDRLASLRACLMQQPRKTHEANKSQRNPRSSWARYGSSPVACL